MTEVGELEGFLTLAKKEYSSICKKVASAILKLELLRQAQSDNEALQNYLMGQIKELS
jgi:hypothetical protein